MPERIRGDQLAAVGSTGNNVHAVLDLAAQGTVPGLVAIELIVEAVGATPTVTFTVQGSLDGTTVSATDLSLYDETHTLVASRVMTTVSRRFLFLPVDHMVRGLRLTAASNTNVTYSARVYTDASGI